LDNNESHSFSCKDERSSDNLPIISVAKGSGIDSSATTV